MKNWNNVDHRMNSHTPWVFSRSTFERTNNLRASASADPAAHTHGNCRPRRSNVTVPVSAGLLADTDTYFDALTTYRDGKPEPTILATANASFKAITNGRQLVDDLRRIRESWRERIPARKHSATWDWANTCTPTHGRARRSRRGATDQGPPARRLLARTGGTGRSGRVRGQEAESMASSIGDCPSLNSMNLPMVAGLARTAAMTCATFSRETSPRARFAPTSIRPDATA
jgi:hypothetical protein